MGVFQGLRCNSVGNTTSSSLDRWSLPCPACGERGVGREGLGGYWGQALASLARANPCVPRPPFSNTRCTKVSRQLLAMSITLGRMGTGYYCHLIKRGGGKGMGSPVLYPLNQRAGPRPVPWDLEPDLEANQGTSSFPASLPDLPCAWRATLHPLPSPHSLLLPRTCCSTSLPASPSRSPQGTSSSLRLPKSTEILGDTMPPSFSCKPP